MHQFKTANAEAEKIEKGTTMKKHTIKEDGYEFWLRFPIQLLSSYFQNG